MMGPTLRRNHMQAVQKRQNSAKFVQAAVRRLAAQKERDRRERAAAIITRVGKGFLGRCAASVLRWRRSEELKERMRRGAILVQSLFRSSAVRRTIRRKRAAVLLQRQIRRWIVMAGAQRTKEAPESVPVRTGPFRYPAGSPGYLRHWELRLRALPPIFSDRLAVRRKIAILRECHPSVPEAVAFCALVETSGDEFRSIALLSDANIAEELAGVASKINTSVLMRLRPDVSTDVRRQLEDVPETTVPGAAPKRESPEPRFLPRDAWAGGINNTRTRSGVGEGEGNLPNPLAMPSFLWQRQLKRQGDSFTRSQAGSPLRRAMMQMEEYGDAIETVKAGTELERGGGAGVASYPYDPDFAHGMPREQFRLSSRPSQKKRPKPKARKTPSADDDPRAMLTGLRQIGGGAIHDTITMSPHARSMRYVTSLPSYGRARVE